MKRKSRNFLFFGIGLILLFLSAILISNKFYKPQDLAINSTKVIKSKMGMLEKDELSLNDIMKQSSYVLVGKIIETRKLNDTRLVFNVVVEENVLGNTNEQVLVYADEELLEVGEKYLFFLEPYISTLYDKDFFTQHPEFVINIDSKGNILRKVNAFENKYEEPFVNDKFNKVSNIKDFIKDNYYEGNLDMPRVEDFGSDTTSLIKQSDYIVEVNIKDLDSVNGLSIIEYDVLEERKGSVNTPFNIILPSNQVEEGKNYLLFLKENEYDSVTLSTRKGSILEIGTEEYFKVVDSMKNK